MNILIVDDHPEFLSGVSESIQKVFPNSNIISVGTAREAKEQFESLTKTEKISLALIDITLPEDKNSPPLRDTGLKLLRYMMNKQISDLNLMVRSANSSYLALLKGEIDKYKSGFVIADKGLDTPTFHRLLQMAIDGAKYTHSIPDEPPKVEPKWGLALKYASAGLKNKAIAEKMNVTPRTIRNYWIDLGTALGVDKYMKEDEINYEIPMLILKAARKKNLISDDDD